MVVENRWERNDIRHDGQSEEAVEMDSMAQFRDRGRGRNGMGIIDLCCIAGSKKD